MIKTVAMHTPRLIALSAAVLLLAACGGGSEDDAPQQAEAENGAQREQRAVSVNVVPVEERQLQAWIYSQGTARSLRREFLTFTQQGMVTYVDDALSVGSPVKAGQLIAHQAPERLQADLRAAKAAQAEAQANVALAEVTRTRYRTLIEQRSASQQELDQAEVQVEQSKAALESARAQVAQAQLGVDESRLISPIDGVLARLNIEQGRYFSPNVVQTGTEQDVLRTIPALVIDPDRFEVRIDLPSYDFRQVSTGARAVIGSSPPLEARDADPQAEDNGIEGRVHAISPSLDPGTRTFEIIIHADTGDTGLHDGEFVTVWIATPEQKNALTVPLEALRFRNDQAFVFVAVEETGKVTERRVELGQQSGNYRAVMDGLSAGELVVTDGRAALNDGQPVRILNDGRGTQ